MGKNLSQTKPNVEKTQSTGCPAQLAMGTWRPPLGKTLGPHTQLGQQLCLQEKFCMGAQGHNTLENLPQTGSRSSVPPQSGSVNHSGVTQWCSLCRDNGPVAVAPTAQRDVRENHAEHDSIPSSSDKTAPHCLATESW